jgi:transcriptional regulator with XRE-family HTH domain
MLSILNIMAHERVENQLKELRTKVGMTQAQLVELVGVCAGLDRCDRKWTLFANHLNRIAQHQGIRYPAEAPLLVEGRAMKKEFFPTIFESHSEHRLCRSRHGLELESGHSRIAVFWRISAVSAQRLVQY